MLRRRFCLNGLPFICSHIFLALSTIKYISTTKIDRPPQNKARFEQEISKFVGESVISNYVSHCSIIMVTNVEWTQNQSTFSSDISSSVSHIIHSNAYTAASLISPSDIQTSTKSTLLKLSSSCKSVVTVLSHISPEIFLFFDRLTISDKQLTRKDEDYFVFITSSEELSRSLLYSEIALLMLYKIVVHPRSAYQSQPSLSGAFPTTEVSFLISTVCIYCPSSMDRIVSVPIPTANFLATILLSQLFPDFTKDFYQHTMRVSAPTKYYATYEMEMLNGKYRNKRGVHTLVFNTIAKKLNMSYSVQPCTRFGNIPEGATGVLLKNGTWAGCMGDVIRGISDMALSTSPDDRRFVQVHFSKALEYSYVSYTTTKAGVFYSWKIVFTALEMPVWALVVASLLMTPTFIHILDLCLGLHEHLSHVASLIKLFETGLYSFGYLIGQDMTLPRSVSSKFLYVAWLFYGLIIGTAYTSSLQAIIVSPGIEFVPRTFSELVHSHYEWGAASAFRTGLGEQLFKNSKNPVMREIYHKMKADPNEIACNRRAILSKYACFNWEMMQRFRFQTEFADKSGNHPFQTSRETAFFASLSFITRKRELFRSHFNDFISRSFDTGLVKQTVAMDWRKFRMGVVKARVDGKRKDASPPESIEQEQGPRAFQFDNVKGCFIVLSGGLISSVASFFLEKAANFSFCRQLSILKR